jgi:hypothetical protein
MKQTIGPLEQRFNAIMNSRIEITAGHVGKLVRMKVSGTPAYGYFDDKIGEDGALKDIYSFNASKATVLDSQWFADNHAKAIALEAAGNVTEAEELFNELLNKSQLSYGVINRDGSKQQFASNQYVDAMIAMTDVKERDNEGKETGVTHKALIVESISAVGATIVGKSKRFGNSPAPTVEYGPAGPKLVPATSEGALAEGALTEVATETTAG